MSEAYDRSTKTLRNRLLAEKEHGGRVFLGMVGVMLAGRIQSVGTDIVTVALSEPDGEGGYVGGDRKVAVSILHIMTVEREDR